MKKKRTIALMSDIALFAALGFILDFFQGRICDFLPFWPNGGSVGFAMCATFFLSFRHGAYGLLCGLLTGAISMLNGVYISPLAMNNVFSVIAQLFLDYFGAWMLVGLAGLFASKVKNAPTKQAMLRWVIVACVVGGLGRYACHFLAGMLYWPVEDQTVQALYSLVYNGSYMLPSIVLSTIIMVAVIAKQPQLILVKKKEEEKAVTTSFEIVTLLCLSFVGAVYFGWAYFFSFAFESGDWGHAFSVDKPMFVAFVLFLLCFSISCILGFRQKSQKNKRINNE